jgi:hypothetical protein
MKPNDRARTVSAARGTETNKAKAAMSDQRPIWLRRLRLERLEDRRMLDGNPLSPWLGFYGDYNNDNVIDAADYTVWRDTLGSTTKLAADGNKNGIVDPLDGLIWRQNYGNVFVSDYKPAAVIVQPTGVTLPDGSQLDISHSQTQGLQEAFDYAANEGWGLFVLPGTYTLNAHLDIAPLEGHTFRLKDVTLNFGPSVTDYGIRFDSTMIVDWYWSGGALNAPSATSGVLFQPRSPHPLDGIVYGTSGVVDSRFDFSVPITAASYDVTMQTTAAPVNDALFHFSGLGRNDVHYVGGGFSPTNVYGDGRTDDPIPFDLFSPAGRVTVLPPVNQITQGGPGSIGKVYGPDGKLIDTTNSTTSGLQEAFNYAAAHNLDVLVFGRGVRNVDPFSQYGLFSLNAPLTVGPLDHRTYELYGGTLNYDLSTGNALTLGDMVDSRFEYTGQVVAVLTNGDGALIKPLSAGVINSDIRIQHIVGQKVQYATNAVIDPSVASIENSQFYLHEMNASYFGITVVIPSASTLFENNYILSLHIHAAAGIGLQLGQSGTNASNIESNRATIRFNSDGVNGGASIAGLQVWGASNYVDLIVLGGGISYGAKFEPGSHDNTLYYYQLQATTPIADSGINNHYSSGPLMGSGSGGAAGLSTIGSAADAAPMLLSVTAYLRVGSDDSANSARQALLTTGTDPLLEPQQLTDDAFAALANSTSGEESESLADRNLTGQPDSSDVAGAFDEALGQLA